MKRRIATALLLMSSLLAACSTASANRGYAQHQSAGVTYAALGASETYGIGADDRYRQAWPQIFFNDALPPTSTLYNFGIPAATTGEALQEELPAALAIHPNVATVWLNVNDLIDGVPVATYTAELRQLVHALRQSGKTRVLVANVPDLRLLPAYRACLPNAPANGPTCPIPANLLPTDQQVGAMIDAYNAAIAQVVHDKGATLVDLFTGDAVIVQHPDWISSDGFHPNGAGYLVIARAFESAYRKAA